MEVKEPAGIAAEEVHETALDLLAAAYNSTMGRRLDHLLRSDGSKELQRIPHMEVVFLEQTLLPQVE
jgi:hypothetical protein